MTLMCVHNENLHSPSSPGGLFLLHKGTNQNVPDDVKLHPGFDNLVKFGVVTIIEDSNPLMKTSGDDEDAGDWTLTGDGTNYPLPTQREAEAVKYISSLEFKIRGLEVELDSLTEANKELQNKLDSLEVEVPEEKSEPEVEE